MEKRRGRPPAPRPAVVRVIAASFWTDRRHEQGAVLEVPADLAEIAIARGQVEMV